MLCAILSNVEYFVGLEFYYVEDCKQNEKGSSHEPDDRKS